MGKALTVVAPRLRSRVPIGVRDADAIEEAEVHRAEIPSMDAPRLRV
jgi:hypothetical protein